MGLVIGARSDPDDATLQGVGTGHRTAFPVQVLVGEWDTLHQAAQRCLHQERTITQAQCIRAFIGELDGSRICARSQDEVVLQSRSTFPEHGITTGCHRDHRERGERPSMDGPLSGVIADEVVVVSREERGGLVPWRYRGVQELQPNGVVVQLGVGRCCGVKGDVRVGTVQQLLVESVDDHGPTFDPEGGSGHLRTVGHLSRPLPLVLDEAETSLRERRGARCEAEQEQEDKAVGYRHGPRSYSITRHRRATMPPTQAYRVLILSTLSRNASE